jgi:hypothetical protein
LYKVNKDKTLPKDKRVAGIRATRNFIISLGTDEAKSFIPLLSDFATSEDINIAYLKKYNQKGTIYSVFGSYLYALEKNMLTPEIKNILDRRILEYVIALNQRNGEEINEGLLHETLNAPTYRMISELQEAVHEIEKKNLLSFSARNDEGVNVPIYAEKEKSERLEKEDENTRTENSDGSESDNESAWWKFW